MKDVIFVQDLPILNALNVKVITIYSILNAWKPVQMAIQPFLAHRLLNACSVTPAVLNALDLQPVNANSAVKAILCKIVITAFFVLLNNPAKQVNFIINPKRNVCPAAPQPQ